VLLHLLLLPLALLQGLQGLQQLAGMAAKGCLLQHLPVKGEKKPPLTLHLLLHILLLLLLLVVVIITQLHSAVPRRHVLADPQRCQKPAAAAAAAASAVAPALQVVSSAGSPQHQAAGLTGRSRINCCCCSCGRQLLWLLPLQQRLDCC
jgi:hypothetical protein